MPRSLKEPVGFSPSHLAYTATSRSVPGSFSKRTKGVPPSPKETMEAPAATGRRAR